MTQAPITPLHHVPIIPRGFTMPESNHPPIDHAPAIDLALDVAPDWMATDPKLGVLS